MSFCRLRKPLQRKPMRCTIGRPIECIFFVASLLICAADRPNCALAKDPASVATAVPATTTAPTDTSPAQLQARIERLVQQLGDKQYLVRQAAQDELCRIGPDAFDALIAAQESNDIEISSRAEYVLQLIRIQWSQGNDGPLVAQILHDYDQQPEADRLDKMQQLAMLPGNQGVGPLCRLVRFEHQPRLSKQAALLVMGQPNPTVAGWAARAKLIDAILAKCARPGAQWLRAYLKYQSDPAAARQDWARLVTDEMASFDSGANLAQAADEFDVQRRLADTLALEFGGGDLSQDLMRKLIERAPSDREYVRELVDWFIAARAWAMIEETAKRFESIFHGDAVLMESLAQAQRGLGRTTEADKLSEQAAELIKGDAGVHRDAAQKFVRRGLLVAAEREYQLAIAGAPQETETTIHSQFELGELLHDQERELEAAKVLQVLIDAADNNEDVRKQLKLLALALDPRARLPYYYACHYQSHNQLSKANTYLDQAIKQDPLDADVLIALYQTSADDPARRTKAMELIHAADENFRDKLKEQPSDDETYNEDAWLIGNTEGDYELAVQYSKRSIELLKQRYDMYRQTAPFIDLSDEDIDRSEGGLDDTLAHCYAGKKDYESAVKYQRLAMEKDPHSLAIRRALADFEAKLAKGQQAPQ
jgi:Tetratricopeptide repeat